MASHDWKEDWTAGFEGREDQPAQEEPSKGPGGYELYRVRRHQLWRPPTDVYETNTHIVIKVEVAGMREEDFDISFHDRHLLIAGHRRDPAGKLSYQNMEIRYGEFRSEVLVDWPVNEAEIEALYENGFLSVRLPRPKEHRIRISTNPGQ